MLEKIKKLQDFGVSLRFMEKESGLGNGTLSLILKRRKWNKTTEEKFNEFYKKHAKELMNLL